jgi:branched-chain amino acid transport system permease protein
VEPDALRRYTRIVVPLVVFGVLALVPQISLDTHCVFSSPLDSPGTLTLLGLMLCFGGIALSYDLLFGYTGLLSFGHALYVAVGVYLTAVATARWGWGLSATLALVAVVGILLPLVLGAISLRVGGIAFAMVTLAFAEAGSTLAHKNPRGWTGAEEGISVSYDHLPTWMVGVFNTKYLYWIALGYLIAVFVIVAWAVDSSPGRVWQAIRENEQRVQVLGMQPYRFKLMVFVLAAFLATCGGVVYALLITRADPSVTTPSFTLALLLMVVIGGAGTRWGAVLGAALYTFLDHRLPEWSNSSFVQDLPDAIGKLLAQPLFVLGTIFILLVYFLPGGIVGLSRLRRRQQVGLALLEEAVDVRGSHGDVEEEVEARI